MRRNNSKLKFKFHLMKGIEMEASNNEYLTHYVGIALLVASLGFTIARLIDAISQSGLLN